METQNNLIMCLVGKSVSWFKLDIGGFSLELKTAQFCNCPLIEVCELYRANRR